VADPVGPPPRPVERAHVSMTSFCAPPERKVIVLVQVLRRFSLPGTDGGPFGPAVASKSVISSVGIAVDPDAPFAVLVERARSAEQLGFETVYVPDHSRPWRYDPVPGGLWFDAVTVLAAFATATTTVRLGTLVTNPILRRPDLVVREALALDHLSSGRFQLGIGTGIAEFDHDATGTPYWPVAERLARFRDFVTFVEGALTSTTGDYTATGTFAGTLTGLPPGVQSRRTPICVAGASTVVRSVAVELADSWNTQGAFGIAPDDLVAHLAELDADVTRRCHEAGRDPSQLRRSVLLVESLSPWSRPGRLADVIDEVGEIGFDEAVVLWPWDDSQRDVFERDTPGLRELRGSR
jgi:alkanesulfonate monooxygenase SsuD/methylene tetrahydromethanopterin reductase-like flavin-dependent oxidoreductase (luciferase family)